MSEAPVQPESAELQSPQPKDAPAPRGRTLRRIGCGLALLFWFALLLTPCALFFLAANGEIRLPHRDIPQPHAHPLLLVSLISERDDRGLRIETSRIADRRADGLALCVETTVRFLLWQYSGGNQDVSYCDCYERAGTETDWALSATAGGACARAD